jgi:phosphate acetyltransferase
MHPIFEALLSQAKGQSRLQVAVAHPCDAVTMESVAAAFKAGLIEPTLVGPESKIRAAANEAGLAALEWPIIDTPHSHASANAAVELVRAGKACALMKGSLHTDELMAAVVDPLHGLRAERRISHCYVMATKGHSEPLIVTDAAINISPDLHVKADIVQNAIDLAHAIGVAEVRVALLSATEAINPAIQSTLDAAALCKMADRNQITGALLDGPLALDNAIDMGAVTQKHIRSTVAGRANVLVVPDLVAGNILAKTLSFMAHAEAAGIVVGARVPIILTSRADTLESRIVSCAIAVHLAKIPVLKGVVKGQ